MYEFPAYDRLVLASAIGFGLIAWGVAVALFAPRGWFGRGVVAVVGAAVGLGGVAMFAADQLVTAASLATLVAFVVTLLGSAGVQGRLIAVVRPLLRPRVFGGVVAVMAASGLLTAGWLHDRALQHESDDTLTDATAVPPITAPAGIVVQTDCGTKITVAVPVAPLSPADANEQEKHAAAVNNLTGKWIRRGPADDTSNCHGWVFAGGRYNLGGRFVDTILADNGYTEVSDPAVGDVCVYRGAVGEVSHTGLVRAVLADGTVLVESKWGRLGVYLHAAGESCYGTAFTFHHSDRGGHTLVGLGGSADKAASSPTP